MKVNKHYIFTFTDGDTGKETKTTVKKSDIPKAYNWTPFVNLNLSYLNEKDANS
jgi:hypothetical protein